MIEQVDALVERLAQIALDEYVDDPELLERALLEREQILGLLGAFDPALLAPDDRARVKAELEAIQARDQRIVGELQELRAELQKAMDQLTSGRAAVRGYGKQSDTEPPRVRRIG
jgi:hypothetical protein